MNTVQIDYPPLRNESTLRKKLRRKRKDFLRKLRKQEAKRHAVAAGRKHARSNLAMPCVWEE